MQYFTQLVADPERLVMLIVVWLVPTLLATIYVARGRSGRSGLGWFLLVFLVPVLGAVITFTYMRNSRARPAT